MVSPKLKLLEQFAVLGKALSNPHRLDLLELIAQGERSVDELAKAAGLAIANASQHLHALRRSGLVLSRKSGQQVLYYLSGDDVLALLAALRQTAERHVAEVGLVVQGYFKEKDRLEPVTRSDLVQRMKDGLVTVLDVRPEQEFAAGHIPGSLNVPLKDLKRRLKDLPKGSQIVAYCRGPYCVLAYEAVAFLREQGLPASRLQDGMPEWRASGLPVEVSTAEKPVSSRPNDGPEP
ncbi:MAG: metalloregulator ArsR/SmtB family transcription factor [Alphaproteobacteria bacterium]|nr:metalloregulator ArsR/SmtB family transcription factor [Alphaproteobacteria bacterium]